MAQPVIVKFSYFGYSTVFDATNIRTTHERRLIANRRIIDAYGAAPKLGYVQSGLPFPDFVPCQVWDYQDGVFD